ncbi:MAG: MBL fold metallo-hydrolase [Gammaproteobacteria bacterium]
MPDVHYRTLLEGLVERGFSSAPCREFLEDSVAKDGPLGEYIAPRSATDGGGIATRELVSDYYERRRQWIWAAGSRERRVIFRERVEPEDVPSIAEMIRCASRAESKQQLISSAEELAELDLIEAFCELYSEAHEARGHGRWPDLRSPGIIRREHSSLAVRYLDTQVILDPQMSASGWTTNDCRYPDGLPQDVAAILLTHGHADHWHLPSVLTAAREATVPVVVPDVPVLSILSEERLASSLACANQRTITATWNSTVQVGDFAVTAVPFYGEQPLRTERIVEAGVRNWGNCYRISCPAFSMLVLTDSGADPAGTMVDVVSEVTAREGPTDIVVANCFEFPEGINAGLPHYAFVLPFVMLQKLFSDAAHGPRASITLGVDGLAEVCAAAQAKYFLPYSHGFEGIGQLPHSVGGARRGEKELLRQLEVALSLRAASTEVVPWVPGDVFVPEQTRV